jgi:hypothetical protein
LTFLYFHQKSGVGLFFLVKKIRKKNIFIIFN